MKEGYIQKEKRKKILLLCDDIRMTSGISTMAREIVLGTAHHFNWVNVGAAINHPEKGKILDISADTNKIAGIEDSSVFIFPSDGYGTQEFIRTIIDREKPDAIVFFTDPRYWVWLFQMENEIRKKIPMIYLNIWDDYPAPIYNRAFYESCDALMAISKQTLNINRLVLEHTAEDKILRYVPHGINEEAFFPIIEFMKEPNEKLEAKKREIFGSFNPDFVLFYNARNIRRKCTSDLIAAYSVFCDMIGKDAAKKCAFVLHTDVADENGTDLSVVRELLCDPEYQKVYFHTQKVSPEIVNILYNLADVTALISSNEGWGLSLTESMMAGKMIIANVTGGMQDQLRFEDENGKWIDFDDNFCSNHFGKYKKHGEWGVAVFPTNMSLVGSIPTPYIFDDRCDFRDVAKAIKQVYDLPSEERQRRGLEGRKWVTSKESMMTAKHMSDNVISTIEDTLAAFKPRKQFELIKVKKIKRKKILHPLTY